MPLPGQSPTDPPVKVEPFAADTDQVAGHLLRVCEGEFASREHRAEYLRQQVAGVNDDAMTGDLADVRNRTRVVEFLKATNVRTGPAVVRH